MLGKQNFFNDDNVNPEGKIGSDFELTLLSTGWSLSLEAKHVLAKKK